MSSNAAELYKLINSDPEKKHDLFRQALQNPKGAMQAICALGNEMNLPVTSDEVKEYLSTIDDLDTQQWLVKARGGL
tara:strand:+ start:274 stop:504 length:231 start_codon:yes stop_codon:yes gene_type:complete